MNDDKKVLACVDQSAYGQSVTDGCIGWEDSVASLEGLAEAVRQRRLAAAE